MSASSSVSSLESEACKNTNLHYGHDILELSSFTMNHSKIQNLCEKAPQHDILKFLNKKSAHDISTLSLHIAQQPSPTELVFLP